MSLIVLPFMKASLVPIVDQERLDELLLQKGLEVVNEVSAPMSPNIRVWTTACEVEICPEPMQVQVTSAAVVDKKLSLEEEFQRLISNAKQAQVFGHNVADEQGYAWDIAALQTIKTAQVISNDSDTAELRKKMKSFFRLFCEDAFEIEGFTPAA